MEGRAKRIRIAKAILITTLVIALTIAITIGLFIGIYSLIGENDEKEEINANKEPLNITNVTPLSSQTVLQQELKPFEPGAVKNVCEIKIDTKIYNSEADFYCLKGFVNSGNTCYFNSIVQMLVNIPAYKNVLLNFKDEYYNENCQNMNCVVCRLKHLVYERSSSQQADIVLEQGKTIKKLDQQPESIENLFKCFRNKHVEKAHLRNTTPADMFTLGIQQDAQEAFSEVLNLLCFTAYRHENNLGADKNVIEYNRSLIDNLISFETLAKFYCPACNSFWDGPVNERYNTILKLTFGTNQDYQAVDISTLMNNFTAAELVDGHFHCCQSNCFRYKTTVISNLKELLVINIVRHRMHNDPNQRGVSEKITTRVANADLININGINYRLVGYIVHFGAALNGGHYVSFLKINDKTYCINDSIISEVNNGYNYSQDAYMLIYSRNF